TQAVEKFDGQNREELLTELKQKNILKSHEIIAQMLS
ncbi:gfo/Idh/MocA family oxidoreductase, partial [Citrobacter sp. TBCS-11]